MLDAGYGPTDHKLYAAKLASEQKGIFAAAIFGEDWQSNEEARDYIDALAEINATSLRQAIITSNDPVKFFKAERFEASTLRTGDASGGTLSIDTVVEENAESIPRLGSYGFKNENKLPATFTVDFTVVDGQVIANNLKYKADTVQ